ncbi:hypothetical protein [Tissierella praeacuta]|uniref:hypothetical protein n=2 Tax=Tissierella praeacuta TaxID=43131 RepID=UPI001C0FE3AF|nr:hypothetical protein [Tissierella praeacuta]MBU5257466.1 hypothetical protein [Tissierella praeacuta]
MKKRMILVLVCIIILSGNITVLADDINNELWEDTYILKEQIFIPDELEQDIIDQDNIMPMYEDPGVGTVKISDKLYGESGRFDGEFRKFTDFETFKYTAITIVKKIPRIGTYVEYGLDIYDALKSVVSDMRYIDKGKKVEVQTWYSYRDFCHWLQVWDYGEWKDIGQSESRYYYKHLFMNYYNNKSLEYVGEAYNFTHSKGCDPTVIAEAPNYMNYKKLKEIAYDYWKYNRGKYYEGFR